MNLIEWKMEFSITLGRTRASGQRFFRGTLSMSSL